MNISKQYIPGIEKGFRFMCQKGYFSGHKLAGLKFRLLDGMQHCVDSSEYAFNLAAQGAMRDAFESGSWYILEPIMLVEIIAPEEFQVRIYPTTLIPILIDVQNLIGRIIFPPLRVS